MSAINELCDKWRQEEREKEQHKYNVAYQAGADARAKQCAELAEAMRPTGGRMWTAEQHACFEALSACANNIRATVGQPVDVKEDTK